VSQLQKLLEVVHPLLSHYSIISSGATKGTDYINGFPYFGCNPISPKSRPKVARQKPHKASPAVPLWSAPIARTLHQDMDTIYVHARVRTAEHTQPRVRPAVELIRQQKFHPRRIILSPINLILSMRHTACEHERF
jgi:hypothetical protein